MSEQPNPYESPQSASHLRTAKFYSAFAPVLLLVLIGGLLGAAIGLLLMSRFVSLSRLELLIAPCLTVVLMSAFGTPLFVAIFPLVLRDDSLRGCDCWGRYYDLAWEEIESGAHGARAPLALLPRYSQ